MTGLLVRPLAIRRQNVQRLAPYPRSQHRKVAALSPATLPRSLNDFQPRCPCLLCLGRPLLATFLFLLAIPAVRPLCCVPIPKGIGCRFRRVSDCTPRSHDTDFGRMGSTHVPKIRPGRPHIRRGGACHSKIMRRGLAGCLFVPCPHAVEHLAQGAVHSEACAGAPRFCHCTGGGTARLYKLCVNKASYAIACIVCFPSKATHAPTWQSRRG